MLQEASAKAYSVEQRLNAVITSFLPLTGGAVGPLLDLTTAINYAIAHSSGTDPRNGDAYGTGFTGQIRNWQPASNPRVLEDWHNVTPPSGWSGTNRYKNLAESNLTAVDIQLTHAGTSGNITCMTIPSGYRPSQDRSFAMWLTTSGTAPNTLRMNVTAAGVVQTSGLPATTTNFGATFLLPND